MLSLTDGKESTFLQASFLCQYVFSNIISDKKRATAKVGHYFLSRQWHICQSALACLEEQPHMYLVQILGAQLSSEFDIQVEAPASVAF